MPKHIVSYVMLCCVLSVISCAQCPVNEADAKAALRRAYPDGSWNGPGPSVLDVLNAMGIAPTKENLLAALNCQDPEIRSLAAGELTHQKVKEAIPELERLLDASEPLWKVDLAVDLALLGDPRGVQVLQGFCDDSSLDMMDRLHAADRLAGDLKQKSCPKLLVEAMNAKEFEYRSYALSSIPHMKELSPAEAAQLRALAEKSLFDEDSVVRMQAASTIQFIADVQAIPALQTAIARETDDFAKSEMIWALKSLQGRQQNTPSSAESASGNTSH